MLLNNRSISLAKDGLTNSVGDIVPNVGSSLQAGCPVLPRGDPDMLIKVLFSFIKDLITAIKELTLLDVLHFHALPHSAINLRIWALSSS